MKLTHTDARSLVSCAYECLAAIERLQQVIPTCLDAQTSEATRVAIHHALLDMTILPSLEVLTRLRMEKEFYDQNYLALEAARKRVEMHRMRKRAGVAGTHNYPSTRATALGGATIVNGVPTFTSQREYDAYIAREAERAAARQKAALGTDFVPDNAILDVPDVLGNPDDEALDF